MESLEERVTALESAVRRLEGKRSAASPTPPSEGDYWLLQELLDRHPEGAVAYGGHLTTPQGPVQWQMEHLSVPLSQADWSQAASTLAALGHPVRLRLLQLVLDGVSTTKELAASEDLGSTGQLHHHLRQLVNAGWLRSRGRGRYDIPPRRTIPLLIVLSACTD